ncbi:alpha/beta hydrolase [Bacillus sp. 3103sda1]|uniref:alpha/beta hydrolase n=1 Tax=Bacillus sp. 3103sda1 TaxID=2953808 RepID=UPI0020A16183|nr:alpha/beta hydrolase [Bacillus sp. 3103sda1]MCP1124425.1 alpha/beta hydrolase [Bacillus sp. 3103sda1]
MMHEHFVRVVGNGQPIIFLPGTGWSGDIGLHIADSVKDFYQVHMIDLPGIGQSQGLDGVIKLEDAAAWLHRYITKLNMEKVILIGHSLGGAICLAYASYYPSLVEGLMLLDIGYDKIPLFPVEMFGKLGFMVPFISFLHRHFGKKVLGKEENATSREDRRENKSPNRKHGFPDNEYIRQAIKNQQPANTKGISLLLALYRANLPKMLTSVQVPSILLYGNRSQEPVNLQNKIKRNIAHVKKKHPRIVIQELDGGHYAHLQDELALSKMKAFIHSLE